jgi:molecular chaperone GrpE
MTQSIDDDALISRFRDWLEQARTEFEGTSERQSPTPTGPIPEVGLFRLVEEFTALRHEVKLETKGSRSLQEQLEAVLPAIRQAIDQFRTIGPKEEQAVIAAARPMAEALADLDEALDRGRLEIEKARDRIRASIALIGSELDAVYRGFPWFRRIGLRVYHGRVQELLGSRVAGGQDEQFAALLEGYDLIQVRLRRAMDAGQVRRIDTVGLPVDPALMSVIEVVDAPDQRPGHVVDEVRRGYTWRGRVLRFAEVRAARERPGLSLEANSSQPLGAD